MKTLSLTLFLALICGIGFAQKQEVFRIDSLPKQGITLDKNWKWHAGDNPEWAKVDFDDSKWDTLNPTAPFAKLPQVTEAEIGWFRLNMTVDSSLLNQPFIIDITPTGAMEIYLNGKLVRKIGKVSKDPNIEVTFPADFDPINFNFSQRENSIAVRYSFTKSNYYFDNRYPFSLLLSRLNGFFADFRKYLFLSIFMHSFIVGLLFIMAVLHLCFYYFYPPQKANFIFSLALFAFAISFFAEDLFVIIPTKLSTTNILITINAIGVLGFNSLMLAAVYYYVRQRFTLLFWSLISLTLLDYIIIWWNKDIATNYFGYFLLIITYLNYIYVSYKAMKASIQSAKFIFYGGISLLIFWILSIALNQYTEHNHITDDWSIYLRTFLTILSVISIPISLSFALARDFAQTSFSLQRNLEEVKQLSEEKQQILSTQNETLEKQVEARTAELKASQNRLIQSEKLASLGELTAGIAHEIQNPLNFVNNFAEMSVSLANELKEEVEKPEIDKELIIDLANDLTQNQEKINFHGKRASSIVTGMLQHSQASSGKKELTDINKLADESLRLSYHGLRAKDKNFNAIMETDFDENLPKISVIPQDIGRVLINLINNAFYATNVGSVKPAMELAADVKSAKVIVSTQQAEHQVIIKVTDNGTGMSEATKAKIFQPFFTTKPTGQGTGLGLSLAYDIITKGHGGTIECESVEGEGTTFIVKLPI